MVNESLTMETVMQTAGERHKRGGIYFEDFEVGKTY
jgi:hypothetical protein